jgi:hypothetical protein
MFGLVLFNMYVMFVIEFGSFLDVAAESYLLYTVKAQVFGSVRLGGRRHVHFYYVHDFWKAQVSGSVRQVVNVC